MIRKQLMRRGMLVGAFAVFGCLGGAGMLLANDDDDDKHDRGNDQKRPPQTLEQGFESTDQLLRDIQRAERGPEHSAWIVESSRFLNVPHRAFQPDVAEPPFIDLPVNIGIIKDPDGDITLYDSGWKALNYIYEWNTSCCWKDLRDQMRAIGLNPNRVVRIIVGHGHWDHAGQLSSFPNAVLYIQKEELKQIDFFLNYPTEFNAGNIRAVNTVNPLTGERVGPPQQACARSPVCGYPPQTVKRDPGQAAPRQGEGDRRKASGRPGDDHPSGVPRPHLWIPAPAGQHEAGAAGVRQRHLFLLDGDPGLARGEHPADGHHSAVPRVREMLCPHVEGGP